MNNPRGKNVVMLLDNTATSGKLILPAGRWRLTMTPSGNFTGDALAFVTYSSDATDTGKGPVFAAPGGCAGVAGAALTPQFPLVLEVCEADRDCTAVEMATGIAGGETVLIVASEYGGCRACGC